MLSIKHLIYLFIYLLPSARFLSLSLGLTIGIEVLVVKVHPSSLASTQVGPPILQTGSPVGAGATVTAGGLGHLWGEPP